MAVKKAYIDLMAFLEANLDKKVKSIISDIEAMCQAKSSGGVATTVHRNEAGDITHVRCSYYKLWMPLSHVEFGAKAGSASGLNPHCKEGSSNFSKQQRDFRKGKEAIMDRLLDAEDDLSAADATGQIADLETIRTTVIVRVDGIGSETIEEALAVTDETLDAMVVAAQPKQEDEAETTQEAAE